MQLFDVVFRNLILTGSLKVTDADGKTYQYVGRNPGKSVAIRLRDPKLHQQLFLDPELAVGEGYMNETLTLEDGASLYDFLDVVYGNYINAPRTGLFGMVLGAQRNIRRWISRNPIAISRKNVAHHYDLGDDLFTLFLDTDRQYSCAYFNHPDDPLETAQINKKRHIAKKLLITPGMKVLDIGSGWGGLGLTLAKDFGADVTGLTLSDNQLATSNARAKEMGIADRCRFVLRDYRLEKNKYDRIVSVGMFEHVGLRNYDDFFNQVSRLLADDGIAMMHTIGKFRDPGPVPSWTDKYIFPGAYVPTVSEVMPPVERSGLYVSDIEILRIHYADTLKNWRQRCYANREKIEQMYDARFFRMWDFYLTGSEVAFRQGEIMNIQIQLEKRLGTAPLTRAYLYRP